MNCEPRDYDDRYNEDRFQLVRAMYCPPNEYLKIPEGSAEPSTKSGALEGTWLEFQIFLLHGEYDLSWDTLFDIGRNQKLPSSFWDELIEIAETWKDNERARKAESAKNS